MQFREQYGSGGFTDPKVEYHTTGFSTFFKTTKPLMSTTPMDGRSSTIVSMHKIPGEYMPEFGFNTVLNCVPVRITHGSREIQSYGAITIKGDCTVAIRVNDRIPKGSMVFIEPFALTYS